MQKLNIADNVEGLLVHAEWLSRLARHLVRADWSEDMVQETFLAAMHAPPDPTRPPRPWLAEVLRNFVRKHARTEARRKTREEAVLVTAEAPAAADAIYERVALQRQLVTHVMALPEPERRIVLLRYFDGQSAVAIATTLGIPAGTVRWRLKEALDRLRGELDAHNGGDRRAWQALLLPVATPAAKLASTGLAAVLAKPAFALFVVAALLGGVIWLRRAPVDPNAVARRQAGLVELARSRGSLRVVGDRADAPATGNLQGKVEDAAGMPVPGAVVAAVQVVKPGAGPRPSVVPVHVLSDARGSFALALAAGDHRIVASAPGFMAAEVGPVTLDPAQSHDGVTIVLKPGGVTLSGTVLDVGGGVIAGAEVRARLAGGGWAVAIADGQGRLALRLPPDTYNVVVDADGYAPLFTAVALVGDLTHSFRLGPAARVAGNVVMDGAAVAGAIVRAEPVDRDAQSNAVTTDADGGFRFGDLNPGRYHLSAVKGTAAGFLAGPIAITAAAETSGLEIALAPSFVVCGRVTGPDGAPVAGAQIFMEEAVRLNQGLGLGAPAVGLTGSDGRYEVPGVSTGRFRVGARAFPHAQSSMVDVVIKDRSLEDVDFALTAGATVAGLVEAADGRPAKQVRIEASVRDKPIGDAVFRGGGHTKTGDDGRFVIEGLGAGVLEVIANGQRHGSAQLVVPIGTGERKEVTLRFVAPAFVTGVVRWDDGTVAAGARVRWNPFGRNMEANDVALVGADGTFRVGPLSPREGVMQAELATSSSFTVGGDSGSHQRRLALDAGQTVTDVVLVLAKRDKSIAGTVVAPDGRPVADARVAAYHAVPFRAGPPLGRSEGEPGVSATDGRFVIEQLPKGRYTLVASHPSLPDVELNDIAGGATGVRMRFTAGARLSGVVRDARGTPVGNYKATLLSAESPGQHNGHTSGLDIGTTMAMRNASGAFSFDRIAAGRYDLLVTTADGHVGRVAAIELAAGDRKAELVVVVGPSLTLRGQVVSLADGKGIADLGIGVMGTRDHVHARTDADGRFAIPGQIAGRTLMLSVRAHDVWMPEDREVTLPTAPASTFEISPIRLVALAVANPSRENGETGAVLSSREPPALEAVLPGSPAAAAGLRGGDVIRTVDGTDVTGWGGVSIAQRLRGEVGRKVELVVESAGERRTVSVDRAPPDVLEKKAGF